MIKKLTVTTILTSALLFTGCGGGATSEGTSSDGTLTNDTIASKDVVFVYSSLPDNFCSAANFPLTEEQEAQASIVSGSLIATEVANGTTCTTYNKEDDNTCLANDYDMGSNTCVIAYDLVDIDNSGSSETDTMECQVNGDTVLVDEGSTCLNESDTLTCQDGSVTLNGSITAPTININNKTYTCQ